MKLTEYKYKINGIRFNVGVGDITNNEVYVEVNGTPYHVEFDKGTEKKINKVEKPKTSGEAPRTESGEKVVAKPVVASKAATVKSPLPGTIMSFNVAVGDTVEPGATVCVLEAMKMDNDIHTIKGGVVKEILCKVGDSVLEGTDLMIIE